MNKITFRFLAVVLALSMVTVAYRHEVHGQQTYLMTTVDAPQQYLNGVLQSNVRCDTVTGTTASNGTATINISGMGYTTLLGIPQTQLSGSSIGSIIVTSASSTSISILANGTSVVSILSINVTVFATGALPYSIFVCGI